MKRTTICLSLSMLVAICAFAQRTNSRSGAASDAATTEKWEYLVVAGANSNLSSTGNSSMRKEPPGPFGRESFVLEQDMDKLGAKGWELVSVAGGANDPIYYFKRRK
ncbi:MAG TPA: hypothetical protein VF525_06070 [Pyrinomonadaceae bacterium]|jgi:hypothetical protein